MPVPFDEEGSAAARGVENVGGGGNAQGGDAIEDVPCDGGGRVVFALLLALSAVEKAIVNAGHQVAARRGEVEAGEPEHRPLDRPAEVRIGHGDDPVHLGLVERGGIEVPARAVRFLKQPGVPEIEILTHSLEGGDAAVAEVAAAAAAIGGINVEEAVIFEKPDQENSGKDQVGRLVCEELLDLRAFVRDVKAGPLSEARQCV